MLAVGPAPGLCVSWGVDGARRWAAHAESSPERVSHTVTAASPHLSQGTPTSPKIGWVAPPASRSLRLLLVPAQD